MTFNEQLAKYLTETWSYQKNQSLFGDIQLQGKNLYSPDKVICVNATKAGNVLTFKGTGVVTNYYIVANLIPLKPDAIYTITAEVITNNLDSICQVWTADSFDVFTTIAGKPILSITAGGTGKFAGIYKTKSVVIGKVVAFRLLGGTSGREISLKIMIAEGEVDDTYQDYINTPTLSPNNPCKIKYIGSPLQIITANSNIAGYIDFFNYLNTAAEAYGATGIYFPEAAEPHFVENIPVDGRKVARIAPWGTIPFVVWTGNVFKPNTQYTIKWDTKCINLEDPRNVGIRYYYSDGTDYSVFIAKPTTWTTLSFTSTAGKTVIGIAITYAIGVGGIYVDLDSIQFFEGTVAPPYEPHRGSITQVELKDVDSIPIELYSDALGTKDEVDVDRGVVAKRIHKVNLKGISISEMAGVNWQKPTATGVLSYSALPINRQGAPTSHAVLSTHFKPGSWNLTGTTSPYNYLMVGSRTAYITIENDAVGIVAGDTDNQKVSKIQSWFANNDVVAYYELQTPYELPLHEDTISQLKGALLRRPDDDSDYHLWSENTPVAPAITYDTFKWQEPVFDRTLQNAKNARMGIQADFAKGIFSDTVWNRIKGNQIVIKYLISWFYEYMPVELLDLEVKKQDLAGFASWADIESWITDLDLNEMATNDRTLMKQLPTAHANYVPPKNDYVGGLGSGSTSPDWNDLNLLERTLQLIKETILSTIANYRICGEPITSANPQQIDII